MTKPNCYNREPFKKTLIVKDGMSYIMSGDTGVAAYKVKEIPFVNSPGCHSQSENCGGCRWVTSEQTVPAG